MGQTRYPCSNQQCQNTFHYEPQCPNLGMARPMVRRAPVAPPSAQRTEAKHSDLSRFFNEGTGFRDAESQGYVISANKGERVAMVLRPNPDYPGAAAKVAEQGPDSMFTRLEATSEICSVERLPDNEGFVVRTYPAPQDGSQIVPAESMGFIYDEAGVEYDEDSGEGEFLRHETYIERKPDVGDHLVIREEHQSGRRYYVVGVAERQDGVEDYVIATDKETLDRQMRIQGEHYIDTFERELYQEDDD